MLVQTNTYLLLSGLHTIMRLAPVATGARTAARVDAVSWADFIVRAIVTGVGGVWSLLEVC
jgi:hypothetical protein